MWLKYVIGLFLLLGIFQTTNKRIEPKRNLVLFFSKYRSLTKYIQAMAQYESGNFTNKLSRDYYNIFSMTQPFVRNSIEVGATGLRGDIDSQSVSWQIYDSYTMASKDLILWMDSTKFPTNIKDVSDFAIQLKLRGYYTAATFQYTNGLKKYL